MGGASERDVNVFETFQQQQSLKHRISPPTPSLLLYFYIPLRLYLSVCFSLRQAKEKKKKDGVILCNWTSFNNTWLFVSNAGRKKQQNSILLLLLLVVVTVNSETYFNSSCNSNCFTNSNCNFVINSFD